MINASPVDIVFTHRASSKLRTPTPTPTITNQKNSSSNYVSSDEKVSTNNSLTSFNIFEQLTLILPVLSLLINIITLLLVVGMIMAK